jgi:hypothetical protein
VTGKAGDSHNEISGAVLGNVVQARNIVVNLYEDRGEFPLEGYLHAVKRAAEEHPVISRSAFSTAPTIPLNDVYTDQTLKAQPEAWPPQPDSTWQELLDRHRHLVIRGGPGGGKSSLLRHIAHTLAERKLAGEQTACVPVRLHARAFRKGVPLADAIREGVVAELGHRLLRDLPKDMFTKAATGTTPWLVLVDGLDEISADARDVVTQAVTDGMRYPFLRFVLASRPLPIPDLDFVSSYQLLPFDLPALGRFAERWLGRHGLTNATELANRLLDHVHRARIRDWADRPLAATMLCELLALAPDRPLPENSAVLYDRYVHKLLMLRGTNAERKSHRDIVWLLEDVAFLCQTGGVDGSMLMAAFDLVRGTALEPEADDPGLGALELRDRLCRTGLVVAIGSDIEFAHRTLEEYFAARHMVAALSTMSETDRLRALRQFIDDLAATFMPLFGDPGKLVWSSVVLLLLVNLWAERKKNDDSLLVQLVRTAGRWSWRLINRLQAEGMTIGPRVLDEVAATSLDDSLEVYEQLRAATLLADLGHPEGVKRLLVMAADADMPDSHRITAMRVIGASGPGATALWFLTTCDEFADWEFPHSAPDAPEPGPDDEHFAGLLLVLEDERFMDITRVTAGALAAVNEVPGAYQQLLSTRFTTPVTGLLGDASARGASATRSVLLRMVRDPDLAAHKRFDAANELHMLDEDDRDSPFRALAEDDTLEPRFRQAASQQLDALG